MLTDRFATTDGWGRQCNDFNQYCGGTFRGLMNRQDHIEDLGFDAVWISPISMQGADSMQHAGYHGYWPSDHYQVNPSFGSQQDLQELMQAYHNKGESASRA